MIIEFNKLKAALLFASTDQQRQYLCGVYVESREGILTIVGLDGHRLVLFNEKRDKNKEVKDCNFIIPSECLKKIKKQKNIDDVEIDFNEGAISISYDGDTYRCKEIDGVYPDYKRVMPNESEYKKASGTNAIGFNPSYLADFNKINRLFGCPKHGIEMLVKDATSPVLIRLNNNHLDIYTGVLMPMKL